MYSSNYSYAIHAIYRVYIHTYIAYIRVVVIDDTNKCILFHVCVMIVNTCTAYRIP